MHGDGAVCGSLLLPSRIAGEGGSDVRTTDVPRRKVVHQNKRMVIIDFLTQNLLDH